MVETSPNLTETQQDTLVVDLMPEGFAIEKNPTPIARMAINVPSPPTETIMNQVAGEDDSQSERFVPYGQEHMEVDETSNTLTTGINLVSEDGLVKPILAESESETEPETNRTRELVRSVRRSRLGKAAAAMAVVAGELLSMGVSPAEADNSLEQECVQAALKRPTILKAGIKRAGKSRQTVFMTAKYAAMPENCRGEYYRGNHAKAQLLRHGKWVNMSYGWGGIFGGVPDGQGGLDTQAPFIGTFNERPLGHEKPWYFQPCRAARILLKENLTKPVEHNDTGYHPTHNIAQKVHKIRIPASHIWPHKPKGC